MKHVRRPDLPWRNSTLTECGRQLDDVAEYVSRDDVLRMINKDGKQRTAYVVCMTCLTTASSWPTFDQDPVASLGREFNGRRDPRFVLELRALGLLVEQHREEFELAIAGLQQVARLSDRRRRGDGDG